MAQCLYLCGRNGTVDSYSRRDLMKIADRITPDNAPSKTNIVRDGNVALCVINDSDVVPKRDRSVCLGQLLPPTDDWHLPGNPVPSGSFALIRTGDDTTELVSDAVASRTLYYSVFDELFVVSTSQRAVMHFYERFVPDESAMAWMISSGTLGPRGTWDRRIEMLGPHTRLTLDRSAWEVQIKTEPSTAAPETSSNETHIDQLAQSISRSCEALEADCSQWALPLSGGLDSRELLLQFQKRDGITAVTWGTAEALEDPESDAVRARELATACGVPHQYHELPTRPTNVETVFDRFLTAGEGRIDHVAGYSDGFETFESLANSGRQGIIRGDVAQSSTSMKSPSHVRLNAGARLLSDYDTLSSLHVPGDDNQVWPDRYHRRPGESLTTWRDRVYRTFRVPYVLAALNDLKLSYVEIANPLLSHEVVGTVEQLPDRERHSKQLFKQYVLSRSPDIPIATRNATPAYETLFAAPKTVDYLHQAIDTQRVRSMLGTELVEWTLDSMSAERNSFDKSSPSGSGWPSAVDRLKFETASRLPASVTQFVASHTPVEEPKLSVDPNHLAFRLFIIQAIHARLREDVRTL